MKSIAIVTGASSGIGKRFAETIENMGTFDEVWAIARRADRLEELKAVVKFPVRPIALDLTSPSAPQTLENLLKEENPDVKLLVNCSGFGLFRSVEDTAYADNLNMVDLNCKAVTFCCQIALPYMREGAKIINIASVAAFQPIPYINVYAASKAYVLYFSRALNRELKKRKISVTAVCPFWTKTEFFDRAVDEQNKVVKYYAAMYDPKDIVKRAMRDAKKGKDVSKYGFVARFQALLCKILPHSFVMSVWQSQQKLK